MCNISLQHVHWAYCPLPGCALLMTRQSWDIPGLGSSLVGQRTVIFPGSGAWVQCRHGPIDGAAQGLCWVLQT